MHRSFDFFLGAGTPNGFHGYFDSLSGERLCLSILKSGPGCGKSTLMRTMSDRLTSAGCSIERIHCSSDPDSLDGLVCRDKSFAIVDGTAPHVVEPKIPGAEEQVISMYNCLDRKALQLHLQELRLLTARNATCHTRAARFLSAVCSLLSDVERTASISLDQSKLERYAKGLCGRVITKTGLPGQEYTRLHSAVTPKGLVNYAQSNLESFDRVYLFDDRYGAAGHHVLNRIRSYALAAGCTMIVCRSPFHHELVDAVYIPDQSLAFCLSSKLLPISHKKSVTVHCRRFYNTQGIDEHKARFSFSLRAAADLCDGAAEILADAKAIHDDIESVYKAHVDFRMVSRIRDTLCTALDI